MTKSPFRKVGPDLYRYEPSEVYYCLLKRGDKQFRRSLKTADRKLADRRLADLRAQVAQVQPSENSHATFDEVALHWLETVRHSLKASSASRREGCIRAVPAPHAFVSDTPDDRTPDSGGDRCATLDPVI